MAITIGDLANETGVRTRTIRFYEEKGLLPRPRRSESGYRLYSEQDIKLLRLIRSARSLGLSIRDVGALLAMAEHNSCGAFQGQAARLIVDKLEQVETGFRSSGRRLGPVVQGGHHEDSTVRTGKHGRASRRA